MNTKLLMTISAVFMGAAGIALTFMPDEISLWLNLASSTIHGNVVLQLLGALYFAFAMVNWTARANLIGGIYGRPIAIGNLTHFTIAALALIKASSIFEFPVLFVLTAIYVLFAVVFAIVFFRHPVVQKEAGTS